MSEFVLLFRASQAEQEQAMGTPERAQKSMEAWLGWIRDLEKSGHLKERGQPLYNTHGLVRARATSDAFWWLRPGSTQDQWACPRTGGKLSK